VPIGRLPPVQAQQIADNADAPTQQQKPAWEIAKTDTVDIKSEPLARV